MRKAKIISIRLKPDLAYCLDRLAAPHTEWGAAIRKELSKELGLPKLGTATRVYRFRKDHLRAAICELHETFAECAKMPPVWYRLHAVLMVCVYDLL